MNLRIIASIFVSIDLFITSQVGIAAAVRMHVDMVSIVITMVCVHRTCQTHTQIIYHAMQAVMMHVRSGKNALV